MRSEQVIVLVQPDDATRVTFEVVLKHEGWTVLGTDNADDALELTRENRPALLIVDMSLPRDTAARLVRTLRSESFPVRVLGLRHSTAVDGADGVPNDVVQTPVDPAQLVRVVRQILGRN